MLSKYSMEIKLTAKKKDFKAEKILSANDAYEYAKRFYFDDINIYESSFIILLNSQLNTIGYAKISQGGTGCVIVDRKLVAKYAIESLASAVILLHNHPSGSARPSREDDSLTDAVKRALELFDIKFADHVIMTDGAYYSYRDNGRL